MAVGSTSSLPSGNGITINIGGGEAANAAGGATAGTDAIQADIQKLVEDLKKLSSGSNATSEGGKSGKSDKSAKSHAPGQEKKANKSEDQKNKLMEMLSQILSIFAKLLGGGQQAGTDSGSQGVAPGEQTGGKSDPGTVINVNTK